MPAWRRADGTGARLDVAFRVAGVRDYVDVTVRHPRALKYVEQAALQDGAAAGVAERNKCDRYPAVADADFDIFRETVTGGPGYHSSEYQSAISSIVWTRLWMKNTCPPRWTS